MSDDCGTVDTGGIRFYDNVVPTLGVGDYLVNVTQRVNPAGTDIDECWAASQAFSVQGPRFALPPDDVFSVFPPANALGQFQQSLPNVVFTLRDLPWERNVFNDPDRSTQTPWMALLLFVEGEQIGGQDALLDPQVTGWTPNPTVSAVIPASEFYDHTTGDGILWPDLQREWYESDDYLSSTGATIIDVAPPAFAALVPGAADLRYLAHARQVTASAKDSQVLAVTGDGWYSVVIGPRLPDPPPQGSPAGQRNIVHLVSLEGLQQYAGGATPLPDGTTRVRMISLQSWTFSCMADAGESFAELMNGLLVDAAGLPKSTTFSLPYDTRQAFTADQQYAAQALVDGYAPMRWQTRLGEQSFAWYRGPFTPVPVAQWVDPAAGDAAPPPFGTASAAMIYDPSYGVFDLSYAVAWETGRLQALADPWFGQALMTWQRAGNRLLDLLLERRRQAALAAAAPGAPPPPRTAKEVLASAKPYAWTGGFVPHLVTKLGGAGVSASDSARLTTPADPTASAETSTSADQAEADGSQAADASGAAPAQPIDSGAYVPPHPTKAALQALLADPTVLAAVRESADDLGKAIAAWLAQRYLLIGAPFETLVPRADLLPPETVRFFWVDPNWLEVLVQGAMSISISSTRDALYQQTVGDVVRSAAKTAAPQIRAALTGAAATDDDTPLGPPVAGMLLRSAAVSGWPGMEVRGYASYTTDGDGDVVPDPDSQVPLLRLERLSADVMLCLWSQLPAVATIAEPAEGIAFGFEDPPTGEGDWLYLRSVDSSDYGMPLCTGTGTCAYTIDAVATGIIDPTLRTIKITAAGGAVDLMQSTLPGNPTLQVRDFAVQMVKVPEQAVFAAPPPPAPAEGGTAGGDSSGGDSSGNDSTATDSTGSTGTDTSGSVDDAAAGLADGAAVSTPAHTPATLDTGAGA